MAASVVELWMSFDNIYRHALSIPVNTCQDFSVHPLTWLRYLGYSIYGNEGYISTLPNGPEVEYYQDNIPPGIYYYVSQEPLLLDPDGMDDRTSNALTISTGRGDFRDRVAARDGRCVMSASMIVAACHVIPHAKGDQYMINLVNHRSEPLDPPLDNINDTRNGILLSVVLHPVIGASQAAFLQTPNFAMTVNDVDLAMQPTADHIGFAIPPSLADTRLTFQNFNTGDPAVMLIAPHNSDAKQSDSNEWPPPLLFNVAYGCAALKTWGVIDFVQLVRGLTRDIYYDFDGGGDQNGEARNNHKAARQKKARNVGQRARNTEDDQEVDYADMLMALWMRNAKKCPCQAQAKKVDRSREKVRTWLESAEP